MGIFVGTNLVWPEKIGEDAIFCPHERQIQTAERIQLSECLTILMMPVFPIRKIIDLKCRNCGKRVVSNTAGKYSKLLLARNMIIGFVGLSMLLIFGYWCIDVPKAFDPNIKGGVRIFLGLFAALGLIIVVAALFSSLKQQDSVSSAGGLDKDSTSRMLGELLPGDGVEKIKEKLNEKGFGDIQINGLLNSWMAPDDFRYASGGK
ncbi:MAG: hypothetical protein HY291_02595 [Planctomycetes bacterium]|nr:hypothetical protein [Planctomycetota bacterium]